jgi:elongation factor Tu
MTNELLTVSATAGPLPETVERMTALRSSGVTVVDVVLTDAGLVDVELLELVELEVRDLAQQHGLTVHSLTHDGFDPVDPDAPPVPYGPAS